MARTVPLKVLIVDDSPAARNFMKALLAAESIDFLEAWDGSGAYRLAQQNAVDLIIADMNMPKLDGIGLLRLLRTDRDPRIRKMPVVMFTGDKDGEQRATEAGATAFLQKPVTPDGVNQVLNLLRKARASRPPPSRHSDPDSSKMPTVAPPRR